jgi:hypothetical protein
MNQVKSSNLLVQELGSFSSLSTQRGYSGLLCKHISTQTVRLSDCRDFLQDITDSSEESTTSIFGVCHNPIHYNPKIRCNEIA